MLFNELLTEQNIDPSGVLVLRHTPRVPEDGMLRKVMPRLAADYPDVFNAYQSTQPVKVEAQILRSNYVASFIGLEKRKGSAEQTAVFVGLYKVGEHRPLTHEEFWNVPAYQQLKEYGMRGFVEGDRPSVLWFDLTITDFYKQWKGKLVIEWPRPPIQWSRFASNAKFPIHAIVEDSILHPPIPDWKDCIWSWPELRTLPNEWRKTLRGWRGIYYIFDQSDGKGYVGAAYGEDNILGRWEHYEASGHGGNVLLRQRSPDKFIFSILQVVSHDTEPSDVVNLEGNWKERLHTRAPFGLNDN
jgi:hypothetical protein